MQFAHSIICLPPRRSGFGLHYTSEQSLQALGSRPLLSARECALVICAPHCKPRYPYGVTTLVGAQIEVFAGLSDLRQMDVRPFQERINWVPQGLS